MVDQNTSSGERLARTFARAAIERPPAEAWQWLCGSATGAWRANRMDTALELTHGEERATVTTLRLRELFALEYAAHFAHETFWLFTQDPLACVPSSGDRRMAEDLESRWRAFDDAVRGQTVDDAVETVRRGALLAEARMSGLFDETLFDARIASLDAWGLPTLTSLANAARTLASYLVSPERQRYVRDAKPATIHDAPLSLDLIRWGEPPPGVPLFAWLSACEEAVENMPLKGTRGTIRVGHRGAALDVKWRSEDGRRNAVYLASLRT